MFISVNQLKAGMVFMHQQMPHLVLKQSHSKTARSRAIVKVEARNLRSRAIITLKLTGGVKVEQVLVSKKAMEFLYRDQTYLHFLDHHSHQQ